jgi:CRP/FNR family transcriptional regulator, cyclic AMP receptor protein
MALSADEKAKLLGAARLFHGVSEPGIAAMAEAAVEVDFPADHVIARQGDIGSGMFIVVSGGARVIRDGAQIAEIGPGGFVGELSVLDGLPRVAQVVAHGPTTCLALSTWDFEAVAMEQPGVALAILRGLAGRLRDRTEADRH